MRLATYNVENLFNRAKAMALDSWSEGKPVLDRFARLNTLLGEHVYTAAMKEQIRKLLIELGLERSDTGRFVNADIVGSVGGQPYAHVMLIDGNDARASTWAWPPASTSRSPTCAATWTIGRAR